MLRHATIPPERAWSTWSERPAEMVFLPLGVRLTPLAYAASTGRATLFPPGEGVRFGPHDLQARRVGLDLSHAGTVLGWRYRKPDPFRVVGGWTATALGEWGLRFWVTLCLSAEGGETVRFDAATGAATVKVGTRFVALVAAEPPVQVTGHGTVEDVAADYETHGYFHLASRAESAPVLALRFNLEMSRDNRFGLAVADREDLAVEQACAALDTPGNALPTHTGRHSGALDAIRDVMGWNTVWDPVNARPYTSISRNWNIAKFGGFGVWLDDQLYHAAMAGLLDPAVGRENLMAVLASATPQGNLACLVTANDAWVDRTQLPVGAYLTWTMAKGGGGSDLLALMRPTLERNHAWWWVNRDPDDRGLCSYGTSDFGEGLYKGTSFGARNESSMDNSPIHDEARYDPATRTLDCFDVGLNSLLALDAEMLGRIAAELGDTAAAARHAARAAAVRGKIRDELWDEARGLFCNRLRSGTFVRSVGPTSFYPLAAGVPTGEQTERLLAHLADPATFAGPVVIPGTSRDDPAFGDNSYWRGRVWPPLNFWVWQGLRRAGRHDQASALAASSLRLFEAAWARRLCPENYNAMTGEPLDQPDTEGFYGWGALLPLMGVGEITDVTPWDGWAVTHTGDDLDLGPLATPGGMLRFEARAGRLGLLRGDAVLLGTTLRGRLTRLRVEDGRCSFAVAAPQDSDAALYLPGVTADRLLFAQCGAADLRAEDTEDSLALSGFAPGPVDIRWTSAEEG